jgi:hypothetical protein
MYVHPKVLPSSSGFRSRSLILPKDKAHLKMAPSSKASKSYFIAGVSCDVEVIASRGEDERATRVVRRYHSHNHLLQQNPAVMAQADS